MDIWRWAARTTGSVAAVAVLGAALSTAAATGTPSPAVAAPADNRAAITGGAAGAAPLGAATLTVPSGALFVSPSGSDAASGSAAAPWRTVTHAMTKAPAGATVVLRRGVYRESLDITRAITLQSHPGEEVWIAGSDVVTGFVPDGGAWRRDNWTVSLPRTEVGSTVIVDPAHPMAGWPEMVFVDGRALRQVATRGALTSGTFFVDDAADVLWIGSDPSGRTVEAAVRPDGVGIKATGAVVRGIGFRHFATTVARQGAVRAYADRILIEHCVFADNAVLGLHAVGADIRVQRSSFLRNGQMGLGAWHADRFVAERNVVSGNNTEHFHTGQNSGGMKIVSSRPVTIRGNVVEANTGHGIWVDESAYDITIVRNIANDNVRAGLMVEISANAVIAGNVAIGNFIGVYVLESNDVEVWNNTTGRNTWNIRVLEGRRFSTDPLAPRGHDTRYVHPDPRITWDVERVRLRNNVLFDGRGDSVSMLGVDDVRQLESSEDMGVTADHDAYWRANGTLPKWSAALTEWPVAMRVYPLVDDLRRARGQEVHGWQVDGGTNPFVTDDGAGAWWVPAGSVAAGKGVPLPSAIATALGTTPGVPVDPGVLRSSTVSGAGNEPQLPTPAGLRSTKVTATAATLTWTPVSGATQYRVERRASGAQVWRRVGLTATTTMSDTTLAAGRRYTYRVVATAGESLSAPSAVAYVRASACTVGCRGPKPWTERTLTFD